MMIEHDCRTITNNSVCSALIPWRGKSIGDAEICSCRALNTPLFPLYEKYGSITQKQLGIEPLFDCPYMQELRVQNKAPHVMGTITKNG